MELHESDNVQVRRGKDFVDYLKIHFREPDADYPFTMHLSRYSVPGRCDTYDFSWLVSPSDGIGDRVCYFTDTGEPLDRALRQLRRDLDKRQVVDMFRRFCEASSAPRSYHRTLLHMLNLIAPASEVYRVVQEYVANRVVQRKAAQSK